MRTSTPEEVLYAAIEMHNSYETWSEEFGWETQAECHRTDYDDLPPRNKKVMEMMAEWHLQKIRAAVEAERRRGEDVADREWADVQKLWGHHFPDRKWKAGPPEQRAGTLMSLLKELHP